MKFFVVFAVALACVAANKDEASAPVVKSTYDITPEGAFQYAYETGNGIYGQAVGEVKNPNSEYPSLSVQGGYKYNAPDGTPIEVVYVADEGGFKPSANHFPTPPPVPEAIVRSLAYIAAHPPPAEPASQKTYG